MKNFLKVLFFSLIMVFLFSAYSTWGIPQIKPAPPPTEEKLDLGSMTMEQFVTLGETIYNGKGTCTLCHNSLGRAPMLDKMGDVKSRLTDARYKGEAKDAEGYLMESLIKPSAFVVQGFGKKGTNDGESPMPDVSTGSIGLSKAELAAVVAFLQDSNGMEVTVAIPADTGAPAAGEKAADAAPRAPMTTPQELLAHFTCGACHKVGEEAGDLGPDLTTIGGKRDKEYLRRAIMAPNVDVAEGFQAEVMPPDYGAQMYAQELEILVDYLAGLK